MMKQMAMVVAALLAAVGLADGARLDISGEVARQTVIAEGGRTLPDGYQGHPTTVLTREGKLICVWTLGHGGPCGPAAESTDGGRTWTRIDDRFPKVYRETHKNCPTLQKCVCRDGHERLFVFSAKRRDPTKMQGGTEQFSWNAPLGIMISDNGGRTWREGTPAEVSSNMPPTGFMQLKDGSLALFGQVRLDRTVKTDGPKDDQGVWMSVSRDDGETWSPMRIVAQAEARNLCEPFCLRSPDGKTLALIMRENRHTDCSMMCFSSDEGRTWTKPVLTAPELTGDRHEGLMLDDGRYLICFRDQMKNSPTAGQYVGWVGSWQDIVNARPGDLRIRLLNHHGKHGVWPGNEWDTGYSGVEKLADGTIICTTYTKHYDDDRYSSVVATRLYPSDFRNVPGASAPAVARCAAELVIDTNRFATADVAAELQRIIDTNPNRTIYLPDGTYVLERAIRTPAHPKRSVTLHLAAFAVLKAAPGWPNGEPLVRLGATHPANDILTVGSNYSFEGGVLDGSGVADGLSIDGGRETHVRDVSIKGTRIGLRIRHGANNGSSDADVDHVNIVCNSALDSVGVLVEGYDNSLTKMRIYGAHTGVRLVGGGNTLRDVHPLFRFTKTISDADYRTSVAFDDIGGGNVYDYCYSDQLATGFRIAANRRSQYDRCFAFWYSPRGGRQVGFECLGRFESRVRDFRIDFRDGSNAASNHVIVAAKPGGKGVFDTPLVSGPHVADKIEP